MKFYPLPARLEPPGKPRMPALLPDFLVYVFPGREQSCSVPQPTATCGNGATVSWRHSKKIVEINPIANKSIIYTTSMRKL